MAQSLTQRSLLNLGPFLLAVGVLVFLCAGTLDYWRGWLFLAVLAAASTATTVYLLRHDPALVERRMRAGPSAEARPVQRVIQALALLLMAAMVAEPALGWRFGWSDAPAWLSVMGAVLIALGFWGVFEVYRANSFASATIEISEGQTVVTGGPYRLVRHPMYAAAVVLLAGIPLSLGSVFGLLWLLPTLAALVWRILDEERFLHASLEGYADYARRTRFRLIPGLF